MQEVDRVGNSGREQRRERLPRWSAVRIRPGAPFFKDLRSFQLLPCDRCVKFVSRITLLPTQSRRYYECR